MQRSDNELQIRIKACDNPTFGYRRGEDGGIEKDIFDGSIPDGWVDSPAKIDEKTGVVSLSFSTKGTPVPRTVAPAVDEQSETPVSVPEDTLAPPYEDHKFNVLRAELKRRTGNGAAVGTNKQALVGMLIDLDVAMEAGR